MQKIAPQLPLLADLHKLPAALCCCCWTLYNCPKDLSPFDVYVKQSSQILSTILSTCTHQRIDVHVNTVSNFKYMHISRWKFSFYFSETLLSLNCISLFLLYFIVIVKLLSLWTIEQNAVVTSSIWKHFCGCDINRKDKTSLDKTFVNLTSAKR